MKTKYSSLFLRILIAIIYLQTLYFKFTAHPDSVYIFSALGLEPYGRIGLGVVELITSILILLPSTRIIGILTSFGIISGAIFSHLLVLGTNVKGDGGKLFLLAVIVFVATLLLILIHRNEIIQLIRRKLRHRINLILIASLMISLQSCGQNKAQEQTIKKSTDSTMKMTDAEWKAKLTPEQYYILREKGTERPFTGKFVFTKEKGVYKCAGCGTILFTDDMKFESHCGWPSFDKEVAGGKIIQTDDFSHGMMRTEITCAKCGGHLGHIFDDGPTSTGKRYCVNSGALSFEPEGGPVAEKKSEEIILAGGCFWCMEAVFEELKGVQKVVSGYSGGTVSNPTYKQVCTGATGHAEAIRITYDPSVIRLEELLEVFFTLHDPTTLNRQGADVGTQYRSAIFYKNEEQKNTAEKVVSTLNRNKVFEQPIVTEITKFTSFYSAEDYHQQYYELNKEEPYCRAVIRPKMDKLHKIFSTKLK